MLASNAEREQSRAVNSANIHIFTESIEESTSFLTLFTDKGPKQQLFLLKYLINDLSIVNVGTDEMGNQRLIDAYVE